MALKKLTDLPVSQTAEEMDILAFAYNGELKQCTEGVLIASVKAYIENIGAE